LPVNNNIVDASLTQLNDLPINAEINFQITNTNEFHKIGRNNLVFNPKKQQLSLTTFDLTITKSNLRQKQDLEAFYQATQGSQIAFPFNDLSDNFILNLNVNGAFQFGTAFQISNSQTWQIVKVYEMGANKSFRQINYIPAGSSVEVTVDGNLIPINTSPNDVQLNRNTGELTDNNAGILSNAEEIRIECDLYYILAQFTTPLSITNYGDFGREITPKLGVTEKRPSEFKAKFSLIEYLLNKPFNIDLTTQANRDFETINLTNQLSNLEIIDDFHKQQAEYQNLYFKENINSPKQRDIAISEQEIKHRQLHFWVTFFRSSSGTGVTLA